MLQLSGLVLPLIGGGWGKEDCNKLGNMKGSLALAHFIQVRKYNVEFNIEM